MKEPPRGRVLRDVGHGHSWGHKIWDTWGREIGDARSGTQGRDIGIVGSRGIGDAGT